MKSETPTSYVDFKCVVVAATPFKFLLESDSMIAFIFERVVDKNQILLLRTRKSASMQAIRLFPVILLLVSCQFAIAQGLGSKQDSVQNPVQRAVCQESEGEISISIGKQVFLTYHKSLVQPPDGIDSVFGRSGYIHPIRSPSGREVTGDFAPDHAHQHSFFMAWVSAEFNGHEVDFWNQKKQTGRVSHAKVMAVNNTDSFGEFEIELSHEDVTIAQQPIQVIAERWKVRAFHRVVDQPFVCDFESHQKCVAESPLVLRQYHYGGFGLRGNQQWYKPGANAALKAWTKRLAKSKNKPDMTLPTPPDLSVMGHDFLTSENKRRHDGNHTRARWVTIYGPIDQGTAGIAILSHPENFRSPQHVRLHPSKPYFSYAPVVGGGFQIGPAETYTTRFRVVSYDGQPNRKILDQLWKDYSEGQ